MCVTLNNTNAMLGDDGPAAEGTGVDRQENTTNLYMMRGVCLISFTISETN